MAWIVFGSSLLRSNFPFEADAVKRRAVSCSVRAPHGSTQR